MKHIVFLTLSLTKGGAERVMANMCNEYFCKHYKVSIVTCMKAEIAYPLDPSISLYTLDQKEEQYTQNMALRFFRRKRLLKQKLQCLAPDLIVSFLPEPNFIALSLRNKLRIPTIISVRNDPVIEYRSRVKQILMKHFYVRADGYVFQTEDAKAYFSFSKYITKKSVVIPNPLEKSFLEPSTEVVSRNAIIHVGRLEKQKNHMLLLQAFDKVAGEFPEVTLELYGEGGLEDTLKEYVRSHGLLERVKFMGNVNQMKEVLSGGRMFVLSSDYEGMPNALMEAMAVGLPVISTDCPCGGPKTLIRDGENGILVPVNDLEEMTKAMLFLMQNKEVASSYGRKATMIKEEFNPSRIYETWDAYIKNTGGICG